MMQAKNPAVIPRNHKVEEALAAATELGDISVIERLLAALAHPFDAVSCTEYTLTPPAGSSAYQTYCGT